jgi:hypothetical protein
MNAVLVMTRNGPVYRNRPASGAWSGRCVQTMGFSNRVRNAREQLRGWRARDGMSGSSIVLMDRQLYIWEILTDTVTHRLSKLRATNPRA